MTPGQLDVLDWAVCWAIGFLCGAIYVSTIP